MEDDLQRRSDCYLQQLASDADRGYQAVRQKFHAMLGTPPAAMATPRTPVVGPQPCASFCVSQSHRLCSSERPKAASGSFAAWDEQGSRVVMRAYQPLPPTQPYGASSAPVFFDASTRARGLWGDDRRCDWARQQQDPR